MMVAGRVKVTVRNERTREHVTVLLKCIADNRLRQYSTEVNKNWVECALEDATHLFAEVPNQSGWNDKVGTYYPQTGRWYDADNADPYRVEMAWLIGEWLQEGELGARYTSASEDTGDLYTFREAAECGVCGRELTDPESISLGIGPVCAEKRTASHHQIKERVASPQNAGLEDPVLDQRENKTLTIPGFTPESSLADMVRASLHIDLTSMNKQALSLLYQACGEALRGDDEVALELNDRRSLMGR